MQKLQTNFHFYPCHARWSFFRLQITVSVAFLIESGIVSKTFFEIFNFAARNILREDHRDHRVSFPYGTILLSEERTGVPERNIHDPYFGRYLSAIWRRYDRGSFMYVGDEKPFSRFSETGSSRTLLAHCSSRRIRRSAMCSLA